MERLIQAALSSRKLLFHIKHGNFEQVGRKPKEVLPALVRASPADRFL
jgi:hypothetical protein